MRAENRERSVLFVMGPPHSGTTLFDLVTGSHPEAFSLGEIMKFGRADRRVDRAGRVCGICEQDCPIWDQAGAERFEARWFGSGVAKRTAQARSVWRGFYGDVFALTGATVLIDSSKEEEWVAKRLDDRRDWRDARPRLLLVTRDGRAVVNSYRRKRADREDRHHIERWLDRIDRLERLYETFPEADRLTMAYEDLATDPANTAATLWRFLHLDPAEGSPRYWERDHHLIGGNLGTRSLILRQRKEAAGEAMAFTPGKRRAAYYAEKGLGIRLDERWRTELPAETVALFEELAGARNQPFRYGD